MTSTFQQWDLMMNELQHSYSFPIAIGYFLLFVLLVPFLAVNLMLAVIWHQINLAAKDVREKAGSTLAAFFCGEAPRGVQRLVLASYFPHRQNRVRLRSAPLRLLVRRVGRSLSTTVASPPHTRLPACCRACALPRLTAG